MHRNLVTPLLRKQSNIRYGTTNPSSSFQTTTRLFAATLGEGISSINNNEESRTPSWSRICRRGGGGGGGVVGRSCDDGRHDRKSSFGMLSRRTFATTTDKATTSSSSSSSSTTESGKLSKQKSNNDNNNNNEGGESLDFAGLSSPEPDVCPDLIRREVAADLFHQYAQVREGGVACLDVNDVANLLREIGEEPSHENLRRLFAVADQDENGVIDLQEFLEHYDFILDGNPARIILVVGGPGSGKGVLSERLQQKCGVVHLSSGDLLRTEVARGSALGRQVRDIMARGELVSSSHMVALMKRRLRDHPGKRVLLDGFPRSLENAHDLVALCGKPELALHLVCDDTILLERIIGRGTTPKAGKLREDDNFQTAINRLRTFHKYHYQTMEWLREQHVPIVNLDCSGTPDSVWEQLKAIGRLMRPAVKLPGEMKSLSEAKKEKAA